MKVIYTRSQRYLKYIVYKASFYFKQLWIFYLLNKIFRKQLKLYIIEPISTTSARIWFEKLHHKAICLNNICVQWVFTITYFPLLINFLLSLFLMLMLIVSSDSESAVVAVSSSPSVDISTILCESITWVDFPGTLDSIRLFTLRWPFWYAALNWDKEGMDNFDVLPFVIICGILSKNSKYLKFEKRGALELKCYLIDRYCIEQ